MGFYKGSIGFRVYRVYLEVHGYVISGVIRSLTRGL